VRGAAVSNTQAALQQGSGGLPEIEYQAHRIFEKFVVILLAGVGPPFAGAAFFLRSFEELFLVFGLALRPLELHHLRDFLFRH